MAFEHWVMRSYDYSRSKLSICLFKGINYNVAIVQVKGGSGFVSQ